MGSSQSAETGRAPGDDAELLGAVEAFIRQHSRKLAFPPWLEARFEADEGRRRLESLANAAIKTIIPYNVFLIGDAVLVPDQFAFASLLHLLAVSPAMLAMAWFFRRAPGVLARDIAAAALPVLMVAQILAVYCASHAENSAHYLYFVPMVTIVTNTTMRLNYRAARWASATVFLLLAATLAITLRLPAPVALMQCISLAVCAFMSLHGNFDRERDLRRAYLQSLRDRLRVAAVDGEARRDALTGLANRRRLDEAGAAIWSGADRPRSPISVILFDVDRFKSYNDVHGHQAGDACLRRIAERAAAELRGADALVARYGGEEFMALLPRTPLAEAIRIAERLRVAIIELGIPHEGGEFAGVATASFGVASADVSASSFHELTALADAALYAAKRGGRNRVCSPLETPRIRDSAAA